MKYVTRLFFLVFLCYILAYYCAGCSAQRLAPMAELKELGGYSTLAPWGVAEFKDGFENMIGNAWAADELYLVTCAHVPDKQIHPWTVNGHVATLAYVDYSLDIAILKCPSHGLPSYRIRESHIGERCNLIGYLPDSDGTRSVYVGSGTINSLKFRDGYLYNGGCHPGISGSPLFASDGAIIGMVMGYIDCRGSANTSHTRITDPRDILTALSRARLGVRKPPPPPPPVLAPRPASRPATAPATAPSTPTSWVPGAAVQLAQVAVYLHVGISRCLPYVRWSEIPTLP